MNSLWLGYILDRSECESFIAPRARKILDVIFSFTNRSTDVAEKFFCRVDVTDEFPFLGTKMSPYYDR
jgi:hypothetical protein